MGNLENAKKKLRNLQLEIEKYSTHKNRITKMLKND